MAIRITKTFIEEYRLRALEPDSLAMTGRRSLAQSALRDRIAVQALALVGTERILDVGCGSGSFLRLALASGCEGVGLAPTPEEIARLQELHAGSELSFSVGMAQALPFADAVFHKVCCNGVLLTLPSRDDLRSALVEFRRVLVPGGLAFAGELAICDEENGRPLPPSLIVWIWRAFRNGGVRNGGIPRAGAAIVRAIRAAVGFGPPLTIYAHGDHLHVPPEDFLQLADEAGFDTIDQRPSPIVTLDGSHVASETRMDFVLRAR